MPPVEPKTMPLAEALDRLIQYGEVSVHFRPIVDLAQASLLDFEALSRGLSDLPRRSPFLQFDAAQRLGRLVEVEHRVVRPIVQRFVKLGLPIVPLLHYLATGE